MLANKETVHKLIPQKYPMAMVDGLFDHDKNSSVSRLIIESDNIFCNDGLFTEAGIIENIAQTAALHDAWHSFKNNTKSNIGFIGALKRIKIHKLPKVNESLRTRIEILNNLMSVSIIKGEVYSDNQLIAEGEMNIFLQD